MIVSPDVHDINLAARQTRDQGYLLLLFMIWPFMAFLLALRDIGNTFFRKIILLFFILYGFTFHVNPVMDGERYANRLRDTFNRPSSDFLAIFDSLFGEQGALDVIQPLITFLISRLTDMHQFLFAAFALFFGYFHLKSIGLLNEQYQRTRNQNALIFVIFLFFVIPIFEINGFRMWAAAWVYFLGVYLFLLSREKRFIWLVVAAAGVHFSFLLPAAVFVLYVVTGNRPIVFMVLAAGSFFMSELPLPVLRNYAAMLGGGLEAKFVGYSHVKHVRNVSAASQNLAWFMQAPKWLLYAFFILLIAVYNKRSRFKKDVVLNNLLSFTLLFLSFCNVASLIPSGGRFRRVFFIFSTAVFIHYFSSHAVKRQFDKLVLLVLIPMIFVALINFRVGTETLNTVLFLPSPAIFAYFDIAWPVKEWLF